MSKGISEALCNVRYYLEQLEAYACDGKEGVLSNPDLPEYKSSYEQLEEVVNTLSDIESLCEEREALKKACYKKDRETVVALLESISIACYDEESIDELRETLFVNAACEELVVEI